MEILESNLNIYPNERLKNAASGDLTLPTSAPLYNNNYYYLHYIILQQINNYSLMIIMWCTHGMTTNPTQKTV